MSPSVATLQHRDLQQHLLILWEAWSFLGKLSQQRLAHTGEVSLQMLVPLLLLLLRLLLPKLLKMLQWELCRCGISQYTAYSIRRPRAS